MFLAMGVIAKLRYLFGDGKAKFLLDFSNFERQCNLDANDILFRVI